MIENKSLLIKPNIYSAYSRVALIMLTIAATFALLLQNYSFFLKEDTKHSYI